MKKLIAITYFKETGKYLTSAAYLSEQENDWEIYEEVRQKRAKRDLPGLETEDVWFGYCLVDPEGGIRHLLDFTPTSNE